MTGIEKATTGRQHVLKRKARLVGHGYNACLQLLIINKTPKPHAADQKTKR